MKKLSEFKNEKGVAVIADLLAPIARMAQNIQGIDNESPLGFVSEMLKRNPKEIIEIFAILSETPVEEYECDGASLLANTITLASDKELMELFGLQSQTKTSSGSASETIEGR